MSMDRGLDSSPRPIRRWRSAIAFDEGIRSALLGRWISVTAVLMVCWLGAVPGCVDALTVSSLVDDEQRFVLAGGNTLIALNKIAGVSAGECERLSLVAGVEAAVAVRRLDEPATLSVAPGADVTVVTTTAGIWKLLGVAASTSRGAIIASSLAERTGIRDGDWIQVKRAPGTLGAGLPTQPIQVTIANVDSIGEDYAGILLPATPAREQNAEACILKVAPSMLLTIKEALPALLPGGSGQTVVVDRLVSGRFTTDYGETYRSRPLQWAWQATGLILGAIWLVMQWVRRADDALYATMGADASTRLLLRVSQWGLIAALGGAWAVAVGTVSAVALGADFSHAATYVSRHVFATLLVAAATVLAGQLRRPRSLLAELKDR